MNHRVRAGEIQADAARFEMTIEIVPTVEKPATGKITALSVIACLKGMVSTLKVGTCDVQPGRRPRGRSRRKILCGRFQDP